MKKNSDEKREDHKKQTAINNIVEGKNGKYDGLYKGSISREGKKEASGQNTLGKTYDTRQRKMFDCVLVHL